MGPDRGAPAPDSESGAEGPGAAGSGAGSTGLGESGPADLTGPSEAAAGPGPAGGRGKKRKRPFWRDLAVIVVAALVLTVLLKVFVIQVFSIPSGSMENTLMPGDRILVSKVVYRFRPIARGDVVVFSGSGSWDPATVPAGNPVVRFLDDVRGLAGLGTPGTDYVKRVIGVPGDHVACCDAHGRVTVNGVPLSEKSYIHPGDAPSQVTFSMVVPPGRLWVMGDNRADSDDSRYRADSPGGGTIPESAVVGRAFLIIWPLSRLNDIPIPATFAQAGLRTAASLASAPTAPLAGGVVAVSGAALAWRRRRRRRRR
jgi:signal peptidase I